MKRRGFIAACLGGVAALVGVKATAKPKKCPWCMVGEMKDDRCQVCLLNIRKDRPLQILSYVPGREVEFAEQSQIMHCHGQVKPSEMVWVDVVPC